MYVTLIWDLYNQQQHAASSMVEEDSAGRLPDDMLLNCLDAEGSQSTDFCNLDGTPKDVSVSQQSKGVQPTIANGLLLAISIIQAFL